MVRGRSSLATEPGPGVDEPERHGSRVQNHLSPGPLLVVLFQQLQTSVQLHNLKEQLTLSPEGKEIEHAPDGLLHRTI